ncbi:Lrp/AsnC ligand binding domain-containing protein [Candidatus Woesearchaeota archaeon]|nr:Lrp/AsnC ligand binding domain-containing protein [Candidatus Woesearchaeota archaeon]
MKAFVLISLKECDEKNFLEELKKHSEVKHAYVLFGEWDIIAELEMENAEDLGTFIMDNIRSKECVKLTSSLVVAAQ